jgi:hypothetical protein
MKFGDITRPLQKLLDDAREAETFLEQHDSQFARRAYIRSVFAYVEGTIWMLKQACLRYGLEQKGSVLSPAERALLSDKTYYLKSTGEPLEQPRFLPLPENCCFCFITFNRLFSANIVWGVGTGEWDRFLKALRVRNRITHPKDAGKVDVSDEERDAAKQVCGWFNEVMQTVVETLAQRSKKPGTEA